LGEEDYISTQNYLLMKKTDSGHKQEQMEIFEIKEVTEEIVEAFKRLMPQLSSSSQAPDHIELQEIVDSEAVILFMAKNENKIVGSLSLVIFRIPTGMRAWIEDVVVDDKSRCRGIGRALICSALRRARELSAKTVDLTSRPSREAANRLYGNLGFQLRQTNLFRYPITQP
jgi:ribosomal protein S18 acetylase RimI-like enzyme